MEAQDVIARRLAYIECGVTGEEYVSPANRIDAAGTLKALEAAGFRVVPTDLVDNARDVCGPASDEDWTIVRKTSFYALAASFAALDGDDPLNVFAGKP